MKLLIAICFATIIISIVLACTKEELFVKIDKVTQELDDAAPAMKTMMEKYGSIVNDNEKKAMTKAHDDMIKFKQDKEDIKKKVESGAMTVDEGCAEAERLAQEFDKDMEEFKEAFASHSS